MYMYLFISNESRIKSCNDACAFSCKKINFASDLNFLVNSLLPKAIF